MLNHRLPFFKCKFARGLYQVSRQREEGRSAVLRDLTSNAFEVCQLRSVTDTRCPFCGKILEE